VVVVGGGGGGEVVDDDDMMRLCGIGAERERGRGGIDGVSL
jgi:hypothetical protein